MLNKTDKLNSYIGWHIAPLDLKTSNTNNKFLKRYPIIEGETLTLAPPSTPKSGKTPKVGFYGYHASLNIYTAISFRHYKGGILTQVEISDDVDERYQGMSGKHYDLQWAGRSRKTLKIIDPLITEKVIRNYIFDVIYEMYCSDPRFSKLISTLSEFSKGIDVTDKVKELINTDCDSELSWIARLAFMPNCFQAFAHTDFMSQYESGELERRILSCS